jgi:ketosteroid isomerase-like protein
MSAGYSSSLKIAGAGLIGSLMLAGCATAPPSHARTPTPSTPKPSAPVSAGLTNPDIGAASKQVIAAEQAFAKTMADRNFKSFVKFLSPDAVFFNGGSVSRGAAAVAATWEPYFSAHEAPFSWTPDHVEVLASGDLALSTGPVIQDHKIVGRFNSIWRQESPNNWRIAFDKGEAVCGINP